MGDGKLPSAGLIQDSRGNLYGTTSGGEDAGSYGTVFKLDRTGALSVLYSFTGGADGGKPFAGLVRDSAGILYGTTSVGGGRLRHSLHADAASDVLQQRTLPLDGNRVL